MTARPLGGGNGHTVVVGKDEVHILVDGKQRIADAGSIFVVPITVCRGLKVQSALLYLANESRVALNGWCGAWASVYLNHLRPFAHQVVRIACGRFADALIVHAQIGRITLVIDIAVEDDYGDAFLIYLFNNRRNGIGLVGRHDDNVKAVVHEIADIGYLLLVAVLRRAYLYLRIGVENHFALDFLVAFVAPVIAAALRHTYFIYTFLLAGRKNHRKTAQQKQHESGFHSVEIRFKVGSIN